MKTIMKAIKKAIMKTIMKAIMKTIMKAITKAIMKARKHTHHSPTNTHTLKEHHSAESSLRFLLEFVYWCSTHSFSASSWSTVPRRIWYGRSSKRGPTSVREMVLWSSRVYVWWRKEMKSLIVRK